MFAYQVFNIGVLGVVLFKYIGFESTEPRALLKSGAACRRSVIHCLAPPLQHACVRPRPAEHLCGDDDSGSRLPGKGKHSR